MQIGRFETPCVLWYPFTTFLHNESEQKIVPKFHNPSFIILFVCIHALSPRERNKENSWVILEWIYGTPPNKFSHENNLPTVKILSLPIVLSQRVARYILIRQITRVEAIYYKYIFCYLRNNLNNANKNTLSNISLMILYTLLNFNCRFFGFKTLHRTL